MGLVWLAVSRRQSRLPGRRPPAAARAWIAVICLVMVMTQIYLGGALDTWAGAGSFGQRRLVGLTVFLRRGAERPCSWRCQTSLGEVRTWCPMLLLAVWWNLGLMAQFGHGLMDRQRLNPPLNAYHNFVTIPRQLPALAYRFLLDRQSFYQRRRCRDFVAAPSTRQVSRLPRSPRGRAVEPALSGMRPNVSRARARIFSCCARATRSAKRRSFSTRAFTPTAGTRPSLRRSCRPPCATRCCGSFSTCGRAMSCSISGAAAGGSASGAPIPARTSSARIQERSSPGRPALDVDLVVGELRKLPFADGSVTKAYTIDVLEHLSPEGLTA